MALEKFRAPQLPNPPDVYDVQQARQQVRVLELYFNQLDSNTPNYAQSYRATTFIGGVYRRAYLAITATYTVLTTDAIIEATSGTFTVNLPTAVGLTGQDFTFYNSGGGVITIDGSGAETISGSGTTTVASGKSKSIVSNGANWLITSAT